MCELVEKKNLRGLVEHFGDKKKANTHNEWAEYKYFSLCLDGVYCANDEYLQNRKQKCSDCKQNVPIFFSIKKKLLSIAEQTWWDINCWWNYEPLCLWIISDLYNNFRSIE